MPLMRPDETGHYVIPLLSGHLGGANALARELAAITGGEAVITTATDLHGVFAVDLWAKHQNMTVRQPERIKTVSAKLLAGRRIHLDCRWEIRGIHLDCRWEIRGDRPENVRILPQSDAGQGGVLPKTENPETDVLVDYRDAECTALQLVPHVLHLGIGCRKGTMAETLEAGLERFCREKCILPEAIRSAASIDLKSGEEGLLRFCRDHGWPIRFYTAEELRSAEGIFSCSEFVRTVTGVDNVCERAAVLTASPLPLQKRQHALTGVGDMGKLYVVGIGPGDGRYLTEAARAAIEEADVICGYTLYVDLLKPLWPEKPTYSTGMTGELERCRWCLEQATEGKTVTLVCSGDAGVYGMAAPVLELAGEYRETEVEIIPGITAALSGGALLGAPLGHDFCVISLSDRLTDWTLIEQRLRCAAKGDFAICLYNPASRHRQDYLQRACEILLTEKSPETVCGLARAIGREGERIRILRLKELRDTEADMFTTVFVGSSQTRELEGRMVTPRGYRT